MSIFGGFEPESDDEEDEDEGEEKGAEYDGLIEEERQRIERLAIQDFPDDEPFEASGTAESEPEDLDTGVRTSQLRHFVIQVIYWSASGVRSEDG
jgi:hypothetical protein